ncbi:sensor domain-containing diguanylate cyclase [Psychromonas aquimarina]|uniref:sensor domain-containing diguanylate cyclase n=1 Tax=Psychromonas aquimarina TaxID=444919 RepID=UPI000427D22C|nr:sensor domain-containing diguanylate cyclase [Psychromonas aquimarina]
MANTVNYTKANLTKKKRKQGIVYVSLLFLFLILVITVIYAFIHEQIDHDREVKQYSELFNIQSKVIAELSSVGADLIYYSHSDLAIATLSSQDQAAQNYLTSLMYKISSHQRRYDQIRLFDTQGNEIIRLNQGSDFSLIQVPQPILQNKKDRYYFKNALRLQPGQIYTSQFDLNKEQGKIQYPVKPMIRYATPVHSENGELLGAGVINYNGSQILKIITDLNVHEGDQVFLINEDGYYLKGNEAKKEWGFMFPEDKQFRFSDEHPQVWQAMQEKTKGLVSNENGEYYFTQFYLSPSASFNVVNSERVFLIMHVPEHILHDEHALLMKGIAIGSLLVFPMLSLLGWILAGSQVERVWLFKKLNFEAHHDALTGLYNRKAIVDYLEKNISISRRRNFPLAVGFIDVNDLKKTNDQLGHDAGDALIKGVASVITQTIRESDFAARLGGDEFLIVFVDCNAGNASSIMERMQSKCSSLGLKQAGKEWSISHGAAELLDAQDNAEKIIERADGAMYIHKAQQKFTAQQKQKAQQKRLQTA